MDAIPLGGISDDELERLALAADPTLSADAVADTRVLSQGDLPQFYMPAAMAGPTSAWRRPMAIGLVCAFVFIEAAGFCTTYGSLVMG
jgi:hypothetical protein